MPRKRKGRPINGVILIDKPLGDSSNHVVQRVKRLFFAQKAGHTGALDPLATGLLPICLGEATKFSQFLLDANKEYVVQAKLGVRTDTSDADGEIVSEREVPKDLNQALVNEALDNFRGKISQTPSIYSALKYEGRPLYYYARKGIDVPRPTRQIEVFENTIINFENDILQLKIKCSKGTYIRTIVDDLGELLGCGAYVQELRRTMISSFEGLAMHSLEELEAAHSDTPVDERNFEALDKLLLPMDVQLSALSKVQLDSSQANLFLHGGQINLQHALDKGTKVKVYAQDDNKFLGIAKINDTLQIQPDRVVVYA